MASSASLEKKFNAAVTAIQHLPNDGKNFKSSIDLVLLFLRNTE